MFNTTIIAPGQRVDHHHHTDVHEHRAPTDESVKLLKEMEEKARAKVIESIAVEHNAFKCVIHWHQDFASDRFVASAFFELNGKKMTAEAAIASHTENRLELLEKLRDAIAMKIANEAIAEAWRTLNRRHLHG